MTQAPEPPDLDAVQQRYEAVDHLIDDGHYTADCIRDVPVLIAEIRRLQILLNEAHTDADELLYPSSTRGGWVEGEGATGAYTHTREVTEIPEAGITLTYESWGPA